MGTNVGSIEVAVPVEVAYDQWTTLPTYPAFMDDVECVKRLGNGRYRWVTRPRGSSGSSREGGGAHPGREDRVDQCPRLATGRCGDVRVD